MSRKNLCDLRDISVSQRFASMSKKYFKLKALEAMEILSGEQMRDPKKM